MSDAKKSTCEWPAHGQCLRLLVAGNNQARADLAPTDAQVMAHPKVRALVEAASELAQYASYSEIVGEIGVNRAQIRRECDNVFTALRDLEADNG